MKKKCRGEDLANNKEEMKKKEERKRKYDNTYAVQ